MVTYRHWQLRPWILIAAALLLCILLCANEPAASDAQIKGLVAQLGAESLDQRQAAEQRLLEIGVPALSALDAARTSDDIEIRLRAQQIAREINRRRIAEAEVHVIGVYEAGSRDGRIVVRIDSAKKPVVLVVCAREPVNWVVEVGSGVELLLVIASGHHPQKVFASGAEVQHLSTEGDHPREIQEQAFYAYRKGILYDEMLKRVKELTGQDVQSFQGRYDGEGKPFVIG